MVNPSPATKTEFWDGSSWTELQTYQLDRYGVWLVNTNSTAVVSVAGGQAPSATELTTEEWDSTFSIYKTSLKDNYFLIQQQTLLKKQ